MSNLYGLNFKKQTYLLPTLIRNSKRNKITSIYINKKSKKNFLNVSDAINVIIKIMNKSKYRIYNIASNKRISIEKIVYCIKKNINCKIIYSNQKKIINEPKIDISRIKKEYKFKPNNNFEKVVTDIIYKY